MHKAENYAVLAPKAPRNVAAPDNFSHGMDKHAANWKKVVAQ